MELPAELTRIPTTSLDVLRYMGAASVDAAPIEPLAEGTGMSERGIRKAIRGLVTKGYLGMDDNYVYFLTDKGQQAIQDIAAYDADAPSEDGNDDASQAIMQDLVVVLQNPLTATSPSTLQLGLGGALSIREEAQLVLRLSSTSGELSPSQITLDLRPQQQPTPASVRFTPTGESGAIRIRIEALQLMVQTDHIAEVGGMFFDVGVAEAAGQPEAWYGRLTFEA